jgi:hypothetical protein
MPTALGTGFSVAALEEKKVAWDVIRKHVAGKGLFPICAIITWCGRRLLGAQCAPSWLCANFTDPLREVSEFLSRVK